MGRVDLVKKLLGKNNFIDKMTLNINKVNKEDINAFCEKYNLEFTVRQHGAWVYAQFLRNGVAVNGKEL